MTKKKIAWQVLGADLNLQGHGEFSRKKKNLFLAPLKRGIGVFDIFENRSLPPATCKNVFEKH